MDDPSWIPCRQFLQYGLHLRQLVEGVHAIGASSQFSHRLWTPHHELAQHRRLCRTQAHGLVEHVAMFGNPLIGTGYDPYQTLVPHRLQSAGDHLVIKLDDGIAIRLLIAGIGQGIERHRVIFRCRRPFLDQGAEDSFLDGVE